MNNKQIGILAVLGSIAAYLYYQQQNAPNNSPAADSAVSFSNDPLASITDMVTSTVSGWKNVGQGSAWVPALNAAEIEHNIPTDLLARIAYQESHFRQDIITGATASPAGALGLMQLMPQYFTSVRVPTPFTPDNTAAQIEEAAALLATNYASTGSWPLALAAYNAGLGAVQKAGGIPPYTETQNYVAQILADVPAANA